MLQSFQKYIQREQLFSKKDKILLAVSGGMDSMAMADLFDHARLPFAIAHCNFQLRADASDADAALVKAMAAQYQVPYFEQCFDTAQVARSNKESIQTTARRLRYQWLEEIRAREGYAYIATAHHQNDNLETLLYNFTKGCGIRGLHGILPKRGKVIRPLLFTDRKEIQAYQEEEELDFREDASNASDKYSRNYLRHQVVPALESLNPRLIATAAENIQRLRETEFLFNYAVEQFRSKVIRKQGDWIYIDPSALPKEAAPTLLYEFLQPYGFHANQIQQLVFDSHAQSGSTYFSTTHRLTIDRKEWIVQKIASTSEETYEINASATTLSSSDTVFSFRSFAYQGQDIPREAGIVWLDQDQLSFPLTLRHWQAGDVFQPLGMKGKHQSLQDFFTHRKLSRPEKERVWVLESREHICWLVGLRVDERVKVSSETKRILAINIE